VQYEKLVSSKLIKLVSSKLIKNHYR